MITEQTVQAIHNREDLIGFLCQELDWPVPQVEEPEDLLLKYLPEHLNLPGDEQVTVRQFRPLVSDQPWGVFFVKFPTEQIYVTRLRQVLRGLVSRKRAAHLPEWRHPNLLFICSDTARRFTFAHFRGEHYRSAKLATFGWASGEPTHTLCELNLPRLRWPYDPQDQAAWLREWSQAFDVEPVTERFFKDYREVFESVQAQVEGIAEAEERRLFTQNLFNRILFAYFLQKKGWLNHQDDYLQGLLEQADAEQPHQRRRINYYRDFLWPLFFRALNTPQEERPADPEWVALQNLLGDVPFLNGGLFTPGPWDGPGPVTVPNAAFHAVFRQLFDRYNFTVEESTPLDVHVAVDPEMLGKVFEELVTGRKEKGSYYTPRVVVHFMCRESLKRYLTAEVDFPDAEAKVQRLLARREVEHLSMDEANAIADALRKVRVCDPACGSGAFLVGMMQELVDLSRLIYSERLQQPAHVYDLKKRIIQRNLFGADIDRFAVNIAMLRLWLSLAVEYEAEDIAAVPPLPNLDYRIVCGNSLVVKVDGQDFEAFMRQENLFDESGLREKVRTLAEKRRAFFDLTEADKLAARAEIERLDAEVKAASGQADMERGILWPIDFAEAFTAPSAIRNPPLAKGGPGGVQSAIRSGFDILLANPPYGLKEESYKDFGLGSKDSYGLFIKRGLQLLREEGVLCYIVSNTWETIKTHRELRRYLLDHAAVYQVMHVPGDVFGATVNTGLLTTRKLSDSGQRVERRTTEVLAADLERASARTDELRDALETVFAGEKPVGEDLAVYGYPQSLIETYQSHDGKGGLPFFIGSPKLFAFVQDHTPPQMETVGLLETKRVPVRVVEINGRAVKVAKFGMIGDVKEGLTTGNNKRYIRILGEPEAGYEALDESLIAPPEIITAASEDEKENGLRPRKDLAGYYVPLDKGVASETGQGWLPNYFVPTPYHINWSRTSVSRMKQEKGCFFRNTRFYFCQGITFSKTGVYAPTFRLSSGGVFGTEGPTAFCELFSSEFLLGVMCSRWARYVFKTYLCSSIHFHVGDLLNFPIALPSREEAEAIESLVAAIIEKQKADPRYPYHLYEQREIDRLVYDLYGLNEEDIAEVEAWYRRRYPKLAVFEEDDSGFLQELREATAFAADLTDEQWEILLYGKPKRRRKAVAA